MRPIALASLALGVLALGVLAVSVLAGPAAGEGPATGYRSGLLSERDRRAPQEPDAWPWSSIGRVNVLFGRAHRGACTGVLVAPDKVATAGHCLFDQATRRWADPRGVHFVAGVARGAHKGHARVTAIGRADDFDPRFVAFKALPPDMLGRDWAVLTLSAPLGLKPVPVRTIEVADFAQTLAGGETARAGYGSDRPFLLSLQKGCRVAPIAAWPALLAHDCDTMPGDSGSPILLTKAGETWVIGLSTAVSSTFEPGVGHRARFGVGVSANAFADRIAAPPGP